MLLLAVVVIVITTKTQQKTAISEFIQFRYRCFPLPILILFLHEDADPGLKCQQLVFISKDRFIEILLGKILNNSHYRPSRQTALALAVALELPLDEARELLMKAGYGLTHANKTDIVVEYCLMTGHTNLTEINEVLFKLDLQPLGY